MLMDFSTINLARVGKKPLSCYIALCKGEGGCSAVDLSDPEFCLLFIFRANKPH